MIKTFSKYALVLAILIIPAVSLAAEFRVGEQPSTRADEGVVGNVYMAGATVTSAGSVAGDLIAGGGSLVVSGDVGEDVLIGGGNVTILSTIAHDVRVGGGNIVIQGRIGGDLIGGGGQFTVGGPGIAGDVVIGGGTVRIDAPVAGNLRIGGGNVYINAPITGTVDIKADTVTLGSGAVISGALNYTASKELIKESGAVVTGPVHFELHPGKVAPAEPAVAFAAILSLWVLMKFLTLFVCALIVSLVFRHYSKDVLARASGRPLSEMGKGLIVFAALPVASVLLMVTIVGIPFGVLGLMGFAAALLWAWIITPIFLGSMVYGYFSKKDPEITWKTVLLGAFVYSIIGMVPFIGWLAQFLIALIALGVIASIKTQIVRQWR